jgi:hypothetical protein
MGYTLAGPKIEGADSESTQIGRRRLLVPTPFDPLPFGSNARHAGNNSRFRLRLRSRQRRAPAPRTPRNAP